MAVVNTYTTGLDSAGFLYTVTCLDWHQGCVARLYTTYRDTADTIVSYWHDAACLWFLGLVDFVIGTTKSGFLTGKVCFYDIG